MKKILFFILSLSFLSCGNSEEDIIIVKRIPIKQKLDAIKVRIPPLILSPSNIFITNDKLLLFNARQDTVFNIFNLPDFEYISSLGLRGEGPNDFNNIDRRLFIPTKKGFKLFFQMQNTLKEVIIEENKLVVDNINNKHFDIEEIPANGFLPLNDSLYCYWSGFGKETEYTMLNSNTNETYSFSPYPQWDTLKSADEDKMFTYVKNSVVKSDGTMFASFYGYFKRFRIYDYKGNLLKDISVEIPPYNKEIEKKAEDRIVSYYAYPKTVNDYIYVFCKNEEKGENNFTELQVWKWNGTPVASYILEEDLSLFTISDKYKKIYAINTSDENNEDVVFVYDLPFY